MPFSIVEKNRMLDTSPADFMSLHSALPDETGSNEISGGAPAYARLATAWGAAANGQKVGTNTPAFDVGTRVLGQSACLSQRSSLGLRTPGG